MQTIGVARSLDVQFDVRVADAIESSAIEGRTLDRNSVRKSVARHLGLDVEPGPVRDARAAGIAEMLIAATAAFAEPLSNERLHEWHRMVFPLGPDQQGDKVGAYRTSELEIQTDRGAGRDPLVHCTAPPPARIENEMRMFLAWFNAPRPGVDGLLRAGIAHLWFLTIHPFDDGNGRIARALADLALAQDEQSAERYISLSRQIHVDGDEYYDALERAQRGDLDVTEWLAWFLGCYGRAAQRTLDMISAVVSASKFWSYADGLGINERQHTVLARMHTEDWEGYLKTRTYAQLAKTSEDTALRDINDLVKKGLVVRNDIGSRGTTYRLRDYDFWYEGKPHAPSSPAVY